MLKRWSLTATLALLAVFATGTLDAGKKTNRGSAISVTLPTEPLAGAAKNEPIMAVMVQDEGVQILQYEIPLGQSITFRVGGSIKAYMERVGPAPDSDMFIDADAHNREPITVEFEHALTGMQTKVLRPNQRLTLQPVASRRWVMTAPTWE